MHEPLGDEPTLRTLTGPELDAPYGLIMVPAFPPAELVDLDELAGGIEAGSTEVRVLERDGDPLAVAVTEALEPSGAVLLSYFAVRAGLRGGGLGSRFLTAVLDQVETASAPSMIIAEVEHPGHHGTDAAHGDPAARVRFYGRHGARVLDLPYFQPSIAPGVLPVYGMALLALRVRPDLDLGDRLVPGPESEAVLLAMMADAGKGVDARAVAAILTAAADPVGVRLRPVDEIAAIPVVLPPDRR